MKLLRSHNILSGPANYKIPAGQYSRFIIRVTGTNQAAQTLSIANLGVITATWRGVGFMSVPFYAVNQLNARFGGVVETASAIGAAFRMSCQIESSYVGDGNVWDVTDDDDVYINVNLSGVTGTIVASGTLQIFGVAVEGQQAYVPRLFQLTTNVAANGVIPYDLAYDNVGFVFVCQTNGAAAILNLSRLEVEVDRELRIQGSDTDLWSQTNYETLTETEPASDNNILLNLNQSRSVNEMLSDDITVRVYAAGGGACTADLVSCSYDFTPDVLARSKATIDNRTANKQSRKLQLGKKRSVVTAQAISGRNNG